MMVLNEGQRLHFRLRAGWMAGELVVREGLRYTKDQQAGWIAAQLEEACGMGYSIALDEVRSTPWEWMMQPITNDAPDMEATADSVSTEGWEFVAADSGWIIWRRRKAVRELEAKSI